MSNYNPSGYTALSTTSRLRISLVLLPVLAVLAVLFSACSTSGPAGISHPRLPSYHHQHLPTTPTTYGTSNSSTTTTAALSVSRCRTDGLIAQKGYAQVAAGEVVVTYILKNVGTSRCSLYGYPGLGLLTSTGSLIPMTVIKQPVIGSSPLTVVLSPQQSASFSLKYSNVSEAVCPSSSELWITPPNAYHHLMLSDHITPCGGSITVSPVTSAPILAGTG
ncbi:MAG: DUF4232 domain-containing protein [Actinobacteria bacterium]|nr:DUF4232 domain-containing protein [Actinomycetota bacterium]MCL6104108.1 DUF4232 domain-containing protein [Actinomycetota bacterium]